MEHQTTPAPADRPEQLRANLEQIWAVTQRTKSRILLIRPPFPPGPLYPMLGLYLSGTTAGTATLAPSGACATWTGTATAWPAASPRRIFRPAPLLSQYHLDSWDQWRQSGQRPGRKGFPALRVTDYCLCPPASLWTPCRSSCPTGSTVSSSSCWTLRPPLTWLSPWTKWRPVWAACCPDCFSLAWAAASPHRPRLLTWPGWRRFCAGSDPLGPALYLEVGGRGGLECLCAPPPILRNFRFPSRRGIRPFMSNRDRAPGPSPTSDHAFAKSSVD